MIGISNYRQRGGQDSRSATHLPRWMRFAMASGNSPVEKLNDLFQGALAEAWNSGTG